MADSDKLLIHISVHIFSHGHTTTHLSRGLGIRRCFTLVMVVFRLAVKRGVRCHWKRNVGSKFHSLPLLF